MNRRSFLRGTLGAMALPALESTGFAQIKSASVSKRLVCIGNSFGFHAPNFFRKMEVSLPQFPLPSCLLKIISKIVPSFQTWIME